MKILITGGSGVIGGSVVEHLIAGGHSVRLLSRHATEDVKQWRGVEPFNGDVSEAATISGAARGCQAVVHIAGIVAENPPEATFESVNVGGTRNIVDEASRSGARRFILM